VFAIVVLYTNTRKASYFIPEMVEESKSDLSSTKDLQVDPVNELSFNPEKVAKNSFVTNV
jgi:hypothetical protein